ncbi:MAG: DUF4197 domain-containing protein [Methylococcales bacterium]|nr:DUF4197 domain-containing protein [Methylococcales bacterium]
MLKIKSSVIMAIAALSLMSCAQTGEWQNIVNSTLNSASQYGLSGDVINSALSNSEVVSGLKEALANGAESAINALGKPGGFNGNKLVEIAMPDSIKNIGTTARALGQGHYVDSFEMTMNQAAEKAVPEAAKILANAIRLMSIKDAMNILSGTDDAATQYFRRVSSNSLSQRFLPIVSKATNKTGVTAAYKNLTNQAMPFLGGIMAERNLNLDQYVTNKSLDGLFKYIAIEEKRIRNNPAARTSDILKKVFAS